MCIFSRIEIDHCVLMIFFWTWESNQFQKVTNRAFWLGGFKTSARFFKKTRQNATILLKIRILCYDLTNFKKNRQIKAWYYWIDLPNPLRSYNGLAHGQIWPLGKDCRMSLPIIKLHTIQFGFVIYYVNIKGQILKLTFENTYCAWLN